MRIGVREVIGIGLAAVVSLGLGLGLGLVAQLQAHPPEEHDDFDDAQGKQTVALKQPAALPKGLVLPEIDGPKPWSEKPHLNDPDRFQIAIMTDNTGGHRPGIWLKAVEKLNLMRPEFVVSVGDLIEGYSTDKDKVEGEWKEFLGMIDKMDMKFFFVAGNHDVTNPTMLKIWREHFGRDYYSFDYKDVHFVCLNTEDPETTIGEKQLAWLGEDLEKNKQARWTLVFLHKPLWVDAERAVAVGNPDKTNWKKIEGMLGARPHTVFSGHVHYYAQYDRNGMKYYHLATTGGGSPLRGQQYGEFDHVAWLTMEKDGPVIANLMLDGIQPGNVVTEKSIMRFREFLAKTQLEVAPILVEDDAGLSEGRIDLRFTNKFDTAVEVSAKIDGLPLRGLTVDPESLKLAAEPGETKELAVKVKFAEAVDFQHLAQTMLTASLRSIEKDKPMTAEKTLSVVIDRKYPLPKPSNPLVVDGDTGEWSKDWLPMPTKPLVLGKAEDWKGADDAGVSLQAAYDERFLYLAAKVSDERVLSNADAIDFRFDARGLLDRRIDPRLRQGTYRVRVTAPDDAGKSMIEVTGFNRAKIPAGVQHAAKRTADGYQVEVALPIEIVTSNQKDWQSIQLTAVVSDVDEAGQKPAKIVWRGSAEVDSRNTNFGQFFRR